MYVQGKKIFVSGHNGLVGSSVLACLITLGADVLTVDRATLDLTDTASVKNFFKRNKPEIVINCAARVGGIAANDKRSAEFIYENLCMQNNIIHASFLNDVEKLVFLGSSCVYPKITSQPIKETQLLSGYLEETNSAYAVAKIAGIEMCNAYAKQYGCNYLSVMPCNLFGITDNFDLNESHVIPALIKKFLIAKKHNLKTVEVWGDGTPRREFLFVEDLADGILHVLENFDGPDLINIGSGKDLTISELANTICDLVGFQGKIQFKSAMANGTPQKLLDISKITKTGWKPKHDLRVGLQKVISHLESLPEVFS